MSNSADSKDLALPYVLGHSDQEIDRLSAQARLIAPFTRQLFRDAGIVPGMRVLDVGSGAGDVAFLVAELIGKTGEVSCITRRNDDLDSECNSRPPVSSPWAKWDPARD